MRVLKYVLIILFLSFNYTLLSFSEDETSENPYKEGFRIGPSQNLESNPAPLPDSFKTPTPPSSLSFSTSTLGPCERGDDCMVTGCNFEVCQGKNEEIKTTICMGQSAPSPKEAGYSCQCQNNECQWSE